MSAGAGCSVGPCTGAGVFRLLADLVLGPSLGGSSPPEGFAFLDRNFFCVCVAMIDIEASVYIAVT